MPYSIKNRRVLRVILRMDTALGLGFGFVGFFLAKPLLEISKLPFLVIFYLSLWSLAFGIIATILFVKNLRNEKAAPLLRFHIKANWFRSLFYLLLLPMFISKITPIGIFYLVAHALGTAFIAYLEHRQVVAVK